MILKSHGQLSQVNFQFINQFCENFSCRHLFSIFLIQLNSFKTGHPVFDAGQETKGHKSLISKTPSPSLSEFLTTST
ncbi:TPA: hypothetical protein DEG21_04895 [Patescibacteria group bacterium]|nr:hypothetical protein [Candidatus Gracilibacteria bacterium]HBY75168.1 hypothetical protein [Candidatus Gracilibacteria bacterium]